MTYALLALAALAVGTLIGAVGIGGILLIPALVVFGGVPIHTASATGLMTFTLTGIVSTWMFARRGSVDWRASLIVCAGALISSFVGAWANSLVDAVVLDRIIGSVIVFAGINVLFPLQRFVKHREGEPSGWMLLVVVGAAAGFGSGLTGAGGPLFSVPIMLTLGFAPLMTIGVSQVLQIASAVSGTLGNLAFGTIDWRVAAWIIPFEILGVIAGVIIAHRASMKALRSLAAWLCIIAGGFILVRGT